MLTFAELKANLKKDLSGFKPVKIGILSDSSSQFLCTAIKGHCIENGFNPNIFEAPYNQIERQLRDFSSDLYCFKPLFTFLFYSPFKLRNQFYQLSLSDQSSFAEQFLSNLEQMLLNAQNKFDTNFIISSIPEINDQVFGNYGCKVTSSWIYQVRRLNYGLMELAKQHDSFYINDLCSLSSQYGFVKTFSPSLYFQGDIIYDLDFLPFVSSNSVGIIKVCLGKVSKCLVLDLDNTLWGGVIGDDGIENIQLGGSGAGRIFVEFQHWIRQLKNRGILLSVCSKNNEDTAKKVFESHPEMVLKLDDISVFVANWDNKASNIVEIQQRLNIGFDSMVFIDDSAFERNLVRQLIPDICVPEMPSDPAEYLSFLQSLNLFESASFTEEDASRTFMMKQDFNRKNLKQSFLSEQDYLRDLKLQMHVESVNEYNLARITQLIQRSNQFNLRTIRYTSSEISQIASSESFLSLAFSLEDKYGKYGLISFVIVSLSNSNAFVDTWVMSCRVLNRGVEDFILNTIVEMLRERKVDQLEGEFIPTSKNKIVENLYLNLGFLQQSNLWILDLNSFQMRNHFISSQNNTSFANS